MADDDALDAGDTHGEDEGLFEGQGSGGQEGQGSEEADDAALDTGEEQEAGGQENLAQPTRGESRFQRLANENAELKRRLTDLERRPTGQQQQVQQEETDQQFNARVQLLPPDERMEARLERSQRQNQRYIAQVQMQAQDFADKAGYDAKAATDARFKRYEADVEAKRLELLNQGQIVPREVLLKFIIGEKILANQGSKDVQRQRAQSSQRVQRQRVQPSGARSDVQGTRRGGSEADARRRRLEDQQI